MTFINPCKRCLVKPICSKKCDNRCDNINTIEWLFNIPAGLAMVVVLTLLVWV